MKNTLQSAAIAFILTLFGGNAMAQYMVHVAGNNVSAWAGDGGYATKASLRCPMAVTRDVKGYIYIGHGGPLGGFNNDACVRRIDSFGRIITIAGWPGLNDSAQYMGSYISANRSRLQGVAGMCIDQLGNLIIADGKSMVRRVKLNYDTVTVDTIVTVAGSWGTTTSTGDFGDARSATINEPYDVAVDNANNIYVCERRRHVIRKIEAGSNTITTFAGRYAQGFSGDGGLATQAKLNDPRGLHIRGNTLYIADYGNNRVRTVNLLNGIISTMVGSEMGFGGDGGPAADAKLTQPVRITSDLSGNLYIADVGNQRIRKVDMSTGNISTYAGNGEIFTGPDVVGDNGLATAASIVPYGMVFDNCGNMYVGTSMFNVRAVVPIRPRKGVLCGLRTTGINDQNVGEIAAGSMRLFPDPNSGRFTLQLTTDVSKKAEVMITDITGRKVKHISAMTNRDIDVELNEPAGMYFVTAITDDGKWSAKMVKN